MFARYLCAALVCLSLLLSATACSPTPAEPTQGSIVEATRLGEDVPAAEESTAESGEPIAPEIPERTATTEGGGPVEEPTVEGAAPEPATTEAPDGSDLGPLGNLERSPMYDVYVGLVQEGFCGPETNSGWFERLSFDAAFYNVQLVPPSAELLWPMGAFLSKGDFMPSRGVLGEGSIDIYSLCPMYGGGSPSRCTVVSGPHPFEPSLNVVQDPDTEIPGAPLVPGTPAPEIGSQMILRFSIGSAADMGPIMKWESDVGIGALGGALEPMMSHFVVAWDPIMSGEEFAVEAEYSDEGEQQIWSLRFVPTKDE